ncbi:MAG: glycosyltransferase [Bacteroidota bacterium]|nr:glycosyltransferase [Bacteroidota bacterium]
MQALPRITLITPSFQQAEYLEECLRSVHDQGYPDLDHVVVDGGSTDGSAEVIKACADKLSWWCSENDQGQSDALNKGLKIATGEVFGWINSDDLLLPGSLDRIGRAFAEDHALVIYEGERIIINADGSRIAAKANDPSDHISLFTKPCINQQSTFYRMSAVRKAGGVDPALHHVMDLELWWRVLFIHGAAHLRIDRAPTAEFRLHEASKTGKGLEPFIAEQASVLYNACKVNQFGDLAEVLAIGHHLRSDLRPMDVAAGHQEIVRKMTLSFLLKWNRTIYRQEQFDMMKVLVERVKKEELLSLADPAVLDELDRQLGASNWAMFRARRKWKHLFG